MKTTVLVVDDDPQVREVIARALKAEGYEVLEACDGDEAVRLTERQRPGLVLLDLHMPRLDGLAALRDILAIEEAHPVIVLSGDGNGARARLALEEGAVDYLAKPLDLEALRTTVAFTTFARSSP